MNAFGLRIRVPCRACIRVNANKATMNMDAI